MHSDGKYEVYPKLGAMKEDVIRLMEDFLIADFGFSRQDMLIAFSGNRGYHIHVRNDDFAVIGSDERREITNYVRGEGLNVQSFFEWEQISRHKKLLGPKPGDGGYRGRLAQLVINIVENDPLRISRLFSDKEKRDFFVSGINEGNWSRTSLKLDDLLGRIGKLESGIAVRSVNADPAVTYDMSKLIRVPNTIHGDTGFVAKIVRDINNFEPMRHAVINGPEIRIMFREYVPQLELLNSSFGPFAIGDKAELPLGIGIFFISKGSGALIT
jgi:DNA primase small subunit